MHLHDMLGHDWVEGSRDSRSLHDNGPHAYLCCPIRERLVSEEFASVPFQTGSGK